MNPRINRRAFLKVATVATAATATSLALPAAAAASGRERLRRGGLIDVNVTLGRWPFRRLPFDDTDALVAKLRMNGVIQAWAGTFDAVFQKDMAAANARLAQECRRHGPGLLVPFGSVNPTLPDWEEELHRCHTAHRMPGLRLFPNYHGYKLDDPVFARLLALAMERRLIVQVAVDLEDERTQHPLARVPHVDLQPLAAPLATATGSRVVVLNWFRSVKPDLVKRLAAMDVCFDIATVEGVGGVTNLVQQISANRVAFGSHAPFFYFESALLKLKESSLNPDETRRVCRENARGL